MEKTKVFVYLKPKSILMKSKLLDLAVGAGGIGAIETVDLVLPSDPAQITEIGGLIVQILIGLVTLFGLFKKKK